MNRGRNSNPKTRILIWKVLKRRGVIRERANVQTFLFPCSVIILTQVLPPKIPTHLLVIIPYLQIVITSSKTDQFQISTTYYVASLINDLCPGFYNFNTSILVGQGKMEKILGLNYIFLFTFTNYQGSVYYFCWYLLHSTTSKKTSLCYLRDDT